ncbi:MAG: UbiA family prenyltransferase [Promethearchaeota archaeon]|jgi:geranylgeranylglycerol-phosphate geranylgeranyltransferase
MGRFRAYVELVKPFNSSKSTLYYGFCAFIGSILEYPFYPHLLEASKVAVAIIFSAFAIYALNDIFDLDIDRINAPERPLPSGRITLLEAKTIFFIFTILSFLISYSVSTTTFLFTTLFTLLGVIYSAPPIRCKDGLFSNFCWGLGMLCTILGGASIQGISGITLHSIIPAIGLTLLTMGCGFIKDLKDMEGDVALNIRTFPIVFGEKRSIIIMIISSIIGFPLFIFYFIYFSLNIYYFIIIIFSIITFAFSLFLLYRNVGHKYIYQKSYKIGALSGFLINIALIFASF